MVLGGVFLGGRVLRGNEGEGGGGGFEGGRVKGEPIVLRGVVEGEGIRLDGSKGREGGEGKRGGRVALFGGEGLQIRWVGCPCSCVCGRGWVGYRVVSTDLSLVGPGLGSQEWGKMVPTIYKV